MGGVKKALACTIVDAPSNAPCLDHWLIGCRFLGVCWRGGGGGGVCWRPPPPPPPLDAADQVQRALAAQHINVSVSRAGSSRFDFARRGLSEVVRASVHCYTTEAELQRLLDALRELPGAA